MLEQLGGLQMKPCKAYLGSLHRPARMYVRLEVSQYVGLAVLGVC